MCGGGSKGTTQTVTVANPADQSAALRSQAAQDAAQRQVNAAKTLSSSTDQQSFGSELAR